MRISAGLAVLFPFWGFNPTICDFVPWKFPLPFRFGERKHLLPLCFVRALSPAPHSPALPSHGPSWVGLTCGLTLESALGPSEMLNAWGWGYLQPPCSCLGQQDRFGLQGPAQPPGYHDGPHLPVSEAAAGWHCALAVLAITQQAPAPLRPKKRRAVLRYEAHLSFLCIIGTAVTSSSLSDCLCGWEMAAGTLPWG